MPSHSAIHYFKRSHGRKICFFFHWATRYFQQRIPRHFNQISTFDVTYKRKIKKFTIATSYISVDPVKMSIFCNFLYIFYFYFLRGRGPLLDAWQTTFSPRATGSESLVYTVKR